MAQAVELLKAISLVRDGKQGFISDRMNPRSPGFWELYPFGFLLLAIFAIIVGAPLTTELAEHFDAISGPAALAPLTALLTIASAFAVRKASRHPARLIVFAGAILVLLAVSSVLTHRALTAGHLIAQTCFLVIVTGMILRAVFSAAVVDGNVLCGAACVYLLAGVLYGYLFALVDLAIPGSFKIMTPGIAPPDTRLSDQPGWLIYFSFTTLTTVGFGDVLPARSLARSLSVFEAVIGQIMLVVMIARLVGLHVAYASRRGGEVTFSRDE